MMPVNAKTGGKINKRYLLIRLRTQVVLEGAGSVLHIAQVVVRFNCYLFR